MTAINFRSCCERGKREGFTLVEVLVVVAIMSILTGLVTSAVTVGYKKALKTQTRAMITGIEMAVADFQYDEGYYPASDVRDRERNATPELFDSLCGDSRAQGRAGRSAPYLHTRLDSLVVYDEDEDTYRRPTADERWDSTVPKYFADGWARPLWYRENKSKASLPDAAQNSDSYDLWSTGNDGANQTLVMDLDGDDIGNW